MQILETFFYFVITLGILVFVHELGHFLAAKLCGMRAEVFALGMGHRLFGYNKVNGFTVWTLDESVHLGENTDYRVAVLPIGGYVKIAGMIDESLDTEHLDRSPEPWEFRARPIWQRMIVICAGVIMNILLAVVIFWGVNYSKGKIIRETTEIGAVIENSPAERFGFKAGDRILQINNEQVTHWEEVLNLIYIESMGSDLSITLMRNSGEIHLSVARSEIPDPNDSTLGIIPAHMTIVIEQVEPGKPADEMGLKAGDVLVALAGKPVTYTQEVIDLVKAHKGKPLSVEWKRNENRLAGTAIPNEEGRIGVSLGMMYAGPQKRLSYSLFEALPAAIQDIAWVTVRSIQQVWMMISGDISITKNVGGPIKIAQFATQSAELGITTFLGFMAVLSISLAVLNILPFPALDGGHLMFLLYEAIFRREIPSRVTLVIQKAGIALLLAFMAFVLFNDIANF